MENHARAVFFDYKRYNDFFDHLVQEAAEQGTLSRLATRGIPS